MNLNFLNPPTQGRFFTQFVLLLTLVCSTALLADETVWIDVRSAQEYSEGHVPDAINIPYEEIVTGVADLGLDLDQPINVYCGSGRRSGIAKESLESVGYTQVVNLGGLDDALAIAEAEATE